MKHWEHVLATDRAAPGRAISGLAYSMRQLVEAKRELESTGNVFRLAKRMFLEPEVLERRLQRLTMKRLMEQQRDLLAADLAVKTGLSTFESAIERFIVKHSSSVRVPQTRTG
jgi:DNA polymerase III delta subunit